MKIKNIKINNYGNLENKEINLENKINIIYGKNESGKSTLLNFIKNIFYGISKNKNGKEFSDYEKYKPWMKEEFSGRLKYELDNGKSFEIFRDFNKKNPSIFNENLEEISKKFNIDKKDGSQFFYEQTNIDETMLISTALSVQGEVRLERGDQANLIQKLANLAGTGDENMTFKKVMDRLNKKQLEEVGTDRTQERPINIVKNRLQKLEFDTKTIKIYKENKEELNNKKNKLIEKIKELEIQKNIFNQINEKLSEIKIEKEKNIFREELLNKNIKKINELNIEKNNLIQNKKIIISKNENINKEFLEKEKNISLKKDNFKENKKEININKNKIKYISIFLILLIFSIIIKLINYNFFNKNYLDIISYSIIPGYILIALLFLIINKKNKVKYENKINEKLEEEKNKNENNIINTKIEIIDSQIEKLLIEKNNLEEEIKKINLNIENKIDTEIENIREKYKEKINIDYIIDKLDLENIKYQLNDIDEDLNKNKLLLNSLEIEEKNIENKIENVISLNEEYENLKEQLIELEKRNEIINLTKEYLSRAYNKMKNNVTPKFTENLSKSIEEISNKKYVKISVNDENGIIVENQYGEYIPVDKLSAGTIDQLYLSLRLSMIDEISEEKIPIMLDEAFAYCDDNRLENIIKFLTQRFENNQIIIFTCTRREQLLLDKLGLYYNLVEL